MSTPNWQLSFRDLPEIPLLKRWSSDNHITPEQSISYRILNNQKITEAEEKEFIKVFKFYEELDLKLQKLDYSSFTLDDFENFKNYISYAFNYVPLISNKLTVYRTYRLVVNEWVTKKNQRLDNVKYLKYPSLDIVKETNKFNRANTPKTNVLYTAENIDTALKEIKPPKDKIITVGFWKTKTEKEIISYPISHSERAILINKGVQNATAAIEKYGEENSQLFVEWSRHYFKLLGREFTKPISHHYEYFISALFSERILEVRNDPNSSFNYDCIIYPSVGNDLETNNLAIHPASVDKEFQLFQIIEFEIEETYYEKKYVRNHPDFITLASIKNKHYAKKILSNGDIIW
ncbi:RES domain-containing protein [Flavobacterium sp. IMCC34852]|uniref:RES domain-containing protein n=1 Tax=Flavobacterium rivulicola TaxID=2732161 RepID=A0A7Y3W068_9FLAO|nr:RES domain-containing protein [Flavobacterium sp. IMCC34852]NNT73247.1 RES domain-containing protein [Flavobacterium sp. IMCC34852]